MQIRAFFFYLTDLGRERRTPLILQFIHLLQKELNKQSELVTMLSLCIAV